MDIGVYLNTILHDVPSFSLNTDISPPWIQNISVLILCMQWFSQLLFFSIVNGSCLMRPRKQTVLSTFNQQQYEILGEYHLRLLLG
ncbi:hypothetical protein RB195_016405 [Necator americanus]|uniref:Uncharacterized protein n=1 Tax=Necator americanus TaxID=51031 RepID=A0ABR1E9D7_NECAM